MTLVAITSGGAPQPVIFNITKNLPSPELVVLSLLKQLGKEKTCLSRRPVPDRRYAHYLGNKGAIYE
jgi:hypothetical protein